MPLTRLEQRIRRRARARALQSIYAWDVTRSGTLDVVAQRLFDDVALGVEERTFAGNVIRALSRNAERIDNALADVTTNWRLDRIGAIERSVLRLAAAELLDDSTPPRVVIQEAVKLAERYGSPESARFVNGVLDALARSAGRL